MAREVRRLRNKVDEDLVLLKINIASCVVTKTNKQNNQTKKPNTKQKDQYKTKQHSHFPKRAISKEKLK